MNVTIDIQDAQVQSWFVTWLATTNKAVHDGLLTAGRTLCKAFMQYTLPRDKTQKVVRRVIGDIYRVYASPSMVFDDIKAKGPQAADAFWYFIEARKFSTAKKIMQAESPKYGALTLSPFDNGTLHSRMRGRRGQVPKGATPKFVVRERGQKSKLEAYVQSRVDRIGMAKAGWVSAWRELGNVRDVPPWLKQFNRMKTLGTAQRSFTETVSSITIHNAVRYSEEAMDDRYKASIEHTAKMRFVDFLKEQIRRKL